MNKKLILGLVAVILAALAVVGLSGAAMATGNPSADNKKVTLCHATGSQTNPYVKIEVSVMAFYNAGHVDHANDIYNSFTYTTKGGQTVTVPANGDTSLLAFADCKAPKVDEPVAHPEPVFADPCGTENDVFSVAPGRGYTVTGPVMEGNNQVITVTLVEGFKWNVGGDNYTPLRFVKPAFTNVDCGLPDTGAPETATVAGWSAVGGAFLLMLGMVVMNHRRQRLERN